MPSWSDSGRTQKGKCGKISCGIACMHVRLSTSSAQLSSRRLGKALPRSGQNCKRPLQDLLGTGISMTPGNTCVCPFASEGWGFATPSYCSRIQIVNVSEPRVEWGEGDGCASERTGLSGTGPSCKPWASPSPIRS
jgi:hypothetical protein